MYCAKQCTGNEPQNAILVTGSDQNLTANTDRKLYANETAAAGKKCAYLCTLPYVYSNGSCVMPTYSCQGVLPDNAELWDNDNTPSNNNTYYSYSEIDMPTACAFKCKDEYNYIDGQCVEDGGEAPERERACHGECVSKGVQQPCFSINKMACESSKYCKREDNTCVAIDDDCYSYTKNVCKSHTECLWQGNIYPICVSSDIAGSINEGEFLGAVPEESICNNEELEDSAESTCQCLGEIPRCPLI